MNKIFIFCVVIIVILSGCSKTREPVSAGGVLDLQSWDFEIDGIVDLKGEWGFYWDQLLSPKDDFSSKETFILPNIWNSYFNPDIDYDANGYATFTLDIHTKPGEYGLIIPYIYSSYRLFLNGKLVQESGKVGTVKEDFAPEWNPKTLFLKTESPKIHLILQVSNFMIDKGGIKNTPKLGLPDQVENYKSWQIVKEVSIFISMILFGLFLFTVFRREDKTTLWLGIFCILISLYPVTYGERYFLSIFFYNWDLSFKVQILFWYLAIPFYLLYLYETYSTRFTKNLAIIVGIFQSLFSLVLIVLPIEIVTEIYIFDYIVLVFTAVYAQYIHFRAFQRGDVGSRIHLLSISILGIFIINDILHHEHFIQSVPLVDVGLLLAVLIHCVIYSKKYRVAFSELKISKTVIERKNEELYRIDQLKDEFLANTTHELRTPINGIIGLADALYKKREKNLSQTDLHDIQNIVLSGRRLLNLVGDILDFSKLKHGDLNLVPVTCDLHTATEVVFSYLKPLSSKKRLELINKIPQGTPFVLADENRLQQILMNLIGNAIKFTEEGKIWIDAKVNGNFLEIHVADSGIGIPKFEQKRIFESFEQADGSITREYAGTGLGLSITRQLVELHGGTISVESEEGKGSIFSFSLPVFQGTIPEINIKTIPISLKKENVIQSDEPQFSEAEPLQSQSPQYFRIIAVDDDSINLDVIHRHLEIHGYRIDSCLSGKEALKAIEKEKPDLILLDVMMPKMSGYEVCRKIREIHTSESLPIIFLTAKNQVQDSVQGLNMGGNDYLTKPFHSDELIARVQTHLRVKEAVERWISIREILINIGKMKDRQLSELLFNEWRRLKIASYIELAGVSETNNEVRLPYTHEFHFSEKNILFARSIEEGNFPLYDILYLERLEEDIKLMIENHRLSMIKDRLLAVFISNSVIYVKSEYPYCIIFNSESEEPINVEINLETIESSYQGLLIKISRDHLVNRDKILKFVTKRESSKRSRSDSCYVVLRSKTGHLDLKVSKSQLKKLPQYLPPYLLKSLDEALK